MKQQYRLWVIGAVAILLATAVAFIRGNPAGPEKLLALHTPAFLYSTSGTSIESPPEISTLLSNEAGISAFFQTPGPISLNSVRNLYRTIETETAQYIIGSVPVPEYPETEDMHVYIHMDGWVLAYYLKADPTSKIFDWRSYTGGATIPTKPENILSIVAGQIGIPTPTVTFYHFQYPNATNLMLIAEVSADTDSFEVNLTGSYAYYERSWSLGGNHSNCCWGARYYLDDVEIEFHDDVGWYTSEGAFTAAQLLPDSFHVIRIDTNMPSYGGLALVYRVP